MERVGAAERKLGEGCEKLGAERLGAEKLGDDCDGAEKVGAERLGCEKLGDDCDGADWEKLGDERTGGCCCAKPALGGERKLGAGVGVATLGGLDVLNERDEERASKADDDGGRGGTGATPWT